MAHTHDLTHDHKLWDRSRVEAGETVRTAPGNTCTAVAMLENRYHPDKTSERDWVRLNERTVGWPALDHKLVGKGIARGAWGSCPCSRALDVEIAELGSLTSCLECPLRIAGGLDATSEKEEWFGILAALRPFLTC